MNLDSCD